MATVTEDRISVSGPEFEGGEHRRMPLFVVLGVVVVALLGFGLGWLAFRDTGADIPSEVQELVDAYETAWNELDGDAVQALMAPGARHYSLQSNFVTKRDGWTSEDLATMFATGTPDGIELDIDRVHGDLPYLVVSTGTAYGFEGTSATYIGMVGGELMILDHIWFD